MPCFIVIIKLRYIYMMKINLSRILGEKRMSQAELARKTGINPNTINALYNEYAKYINKSDLEKICTVLDCKVADLLEYIPNKK